MVKALAVAERGRGRTSPNPMVGALVVDDEGVIVGRGAHLAVGGPHAEVHALAEAAGGARGATLYCTLEPCSHVGRTGPCAPVVVGAGIRRAVIATGDPNPLVAGRGLAHLRQHGIEVRLGVLQEEARRQNAPFFSVVERQRPFVTLKIAVSVDGKVAARAGARTPLTGASANRYIQRERAEVDAIAVGSGTILTDDPLLTPRGAFRGRPLARVVFDRALRMPASARMLGTPAAGPIIVMTLPPQTAAARRTIEALTGAGARVEVLEDADRFLPQALRRLAALDVASLLVDGGPTLHHAFWTGGLVDRVEVFRTPGRLGDGGVPWLDRRTLDPQALPDARTVALGDDILIEAYVHRAD